MNKYILTILILIQFSSVSYPQYSIDNNKIIETALLLEYKIGNQTKFGSGFLIRDNTEVGDFVYLITAKHVLGKTDSNGNFSLFGNELEITYSGDIYSESVNKVAIDIANLFNHNLVRFNEGNDAAIIFLAKVNENKMNYASAANFKQKVAHGNSWTTIDSKMLVAFEDVKIGNDAFISGYPKTLGLGRYPQYDYEKPLLRKGAVAGIYRSKRTIVVDCPSYGGNSGGPLFTIYPKERKLKLTGIVVEYIPQISKVEMNNSGYMVAASSDIIIELLDTFREKKH
ncbi:serine protease [Draconibacterium sediminis]|uniref:S1 family peptidase n=1 Tax=Draconibacterium sediminis TaxID=1544798 RepID=UPI0026EEE7AD|nr:serine protease [Draconibacterium sediminis]